MAMTTNSNNTNEEMMNNQAHETQAAVDQQQVPATPEKVGFFKKVKDGAKKVANSKPAKVIGKIALVGGGFALGFAAASAGHKDSDSDQVEAEEPAVETTATEETVE